MGPKLTCPPEQGKVGSGCNKTRRKERKGRETEKEKKVRGGKESGVEKRTAHLDAIGYQKVTRALDNFSVWITEIRLAERK